MTPSTPKKPSPFSLRLTFEERARLESEAGTLPLGAYIKLKLLSEGEAPAHNLNQLAHAANTGSLPVTPDTLKAIREACAEVAFMRQELLRALGQRSDLQGSEG